MEWLKKHWRLAAVVLVAVYFALQIWSEANLTDDANMLVFLLSEWFLLLALLVLAFGRIEGGLRAIGMDPGKGLKLYLPGAAVGAGMFLVFVAVALLFGGYRIGVNPLGVDWLMTLLFLIGFVGQSALEEVLMRGLLYYWLKKKLGPLGAVLLTAILFSLIHIPNGHTTSLSILNIALVGIFYGLLVIRTGSLWMACGAHFAWNFLETNVFLVPNSGNAVSTGIFKLTPLAENELLIGKEFGPEGSLTVTIIHLIAIAFVAYGLYRQKPMADPLVEAPLQDQNLSSN